MKLFFPLNSAIEASPASGGTTGDHCILRSINMQNSAVFLYISNEQSNNEIKKMIPFTKNIPVGVRVEKRQTDRQRERDSGRERE